MKGEAHSQDEQFGARITVQHSAMMPLMPAYPVWNIADRLDDACLEPGVDGGYDVVVHLHQGEQQFGLRVRELVRLTDGQSCEPEELGGDEIALAIDEPHGTKTRQRFVRVWLDA